MHIVTASDCNALHWKGLYSVGLGDSPAACDMAASVPFPGQQLGEHELRGRVEDDAGRRYCETGADLGAETGTSYSSSNARDCSTLSLDLHARTLPPTSTLSLSCHVLCTLIFLVAINFDNGRGLPLPPVIAPPPQRIIALHALAFT